MTIIYSDSAEVRVIARAPVLENVLDPQDPRQHFPAGLRVTFLDERQDSSSVLTAKRGVYRERKNQVVVSDSVVWQATAGQRLETDELTWDETRALIFTDRFVVITEPDYIISGYGLEAKQDFSDARIKLVTGRVPINRPAPGSSSEDAGLPTDF
ncbi:MAG: LPS export ABC transporter periplasmic protein LptC [Lewinella sp.]|nr:LPS export ABC transporter periplasmic protein LptC [Lewinella sp.]